MATPADTTWDIEPHTLVKHRILRNYLSAWFPILNRYNRRLVYIDGFSGPGIYRGGEPGSPIIALRVASDHFRPIDGEVVFLFVEERPDRVQNLREEVQKIPLPRNYTVYVESGNFESTVSNILDKLDKSGKGLAPSFTFIDPFGFSGLPFSLLRRLMAHERSEAFITLMVDSINRFVESPDIKIRDHIRATFGTDEVFDIVAGGGDRVGMLSQLYQRQLKTISPYVRSFEMRDRRGRTIYYLLFISKHPLGHLKMKEAMWQVDSDGDFIFSDATNPSQQVFFHTEHHEPLFKILSETFKNRTVTAQEIKNFVRESTPFIDKHTLASLRYGEESDKISVSERKVSGARRRRNSFPDDALVSFIRSERKNNHGD